MRKKLVVLGVVLALVAVGVAVAAWILTSTGSSGTGAVGSASAPTVTAPSSGAGTECFPGQDCAMSVTVNNPNNVPLTLTAVNYSGESTVFSDSFGGPQDAACPASNGTVHNLTGLSIPIPVGTTTVSIPGAYTLDQNAPTGCMGDYVAITGNPTTYTWSTN